MTDEKKKLSLTHRQALRATELKPRREQEARLKLVLVAAELERQINDAYARLVHVERQASRQEDSGRVGFWSRFGKDRSPSGPQNIDELLNLPEVQIARMQYERLVAEYAKVAQRFGTDVASAIRGDSAVNDNTEEVAPPSSPAPTNGRASRGSKWG